MRNSAHAATLTPGVGRIAAPSLKIFLILGCSPPNRRRCCKRMALTRAMLLAMDALRAVCRGQVSSGKP